ncbi:MAG: hemerythrin domain-containing protein [Acidobacteriota bacterium]|nr:hemerythrin domain-containing protein [Acidobacteriota bacterium]
MKPIAPIPFKADFSKPLDFLFHCHQKIAANLEALRRATADLHTAQREDLATVAETINGVLTHLSSSGKKHTRDEEESLFPRLRQHKDRGSDEIFEVLGQLESQHKRAASIERSLTNMALALAIADEIGSEKIALFNDLSESLYDLYRPHIQIENEFIFPASAQILTEAELAAAGHEMFQRRQLKIKPLNG